MTEQLAVAVLGAHGRMGIEAVKAVEAAEDMKLVAALGRGDSLETLLDAGAQYVVDLTVPDTTETNVRFAVEHGIHAVVGTTGWNADRLESLRALLEQKPDTGVLIAPNFALGSVLASAFAAKASQYFESVEIIELHHPNKVDAPSGTAVRTAQLIAEARQAAGVPASPDATETSLDGARGCDVEGVRVHSVRLRGLVAHQEVLFGGPGEQLTLRHDSFDRASFMPGVLLGFARSQGTPASRLAWTATWTWGSRSMGNFWTSLKKNRTKIWVGAITLLLVLYLVVSVQRSFLLLGDPNLVAKGIGAAYLVLPIVGAWALIRELLFGARTEQMAKVLEAEGGLPEDDPAPNARRADCPRRRGCGVREVPGRGRGRTGGLAFLVPAELRL